MYMECNFSIKRESIKDIVISEGKEGPINECFEYLGPVSKRKGNIGYNMTHRTLSGWLKWRETKRGN